LTFTLEELKENLKNTNNKRWKVGCFMLVQEALTQQPETTGTIVLLTHLSRT
jgi:hypothetical protein